MDRRERREAAQFLRAGALALIAFVLVVFLLNALYVELIFKQKQIVRKDREYQAYAATLPEQRIAYGFFGDSRTSDSIVPEAMGIGAYNFGLIGENYAITYYKLQRLIEADKTQFGAVVLEIDPHTFALSPRDLTLSQDQLGYYARDLPYSELALMSGDAAASTWLRSRLLFLGNGEDLLALVQGRHVTHIRMGWTNNAGSYAAIDKERAARDTVAQHFRGREAIDDLSFSYFLKTVRVAQAHGARIYLIRYPLPEEYYAAAKGLGVDIEGNYRTLYARIDEELGHDAYTALDYSQLYAGDDVYFADAHHLNAEGAYALSRRIAQDLSAPERE